MFSRRTFIRKAGEIGGFGGALIAAEALGLGPLSAAEIPKLTPGSGKGRSVAILGAGMAGLSAALRLSEASYAVTILEARERVGGRVWTLRGGDKVVETHSTQICEFESGLYFNCGAARIPSHHQAVLGLCRELGVALEVEVNANRSALLADGATRIEFRQAIADTRGRISEMLATAIIGGTFDKELTQADINRMVLFLKTYGDLSPEIEYLGSSRAGYEKWPGAGGETGQRRAPLSMSALLDLDMWDDIVMEDDILMQATMFQPVGGMDHIPKAIAKKLGAIVKLRCEVTEIRRAGEGVRIGYRDLKTGKAATLSADYCISTIPPPVLAKIPADFSPGIAAALPKISGGNARKIAFEAPRFWEDEAIYGGLSYVKEPPGAVWYPSGNFHAQKGVLIYYANPSAFDPLSQSEQFAAARTQVEMVHPGKSGQLVKPISVTWKNIPYTLGVGAYFTNAPDLHARLNEGDGPIYFAGDYLSEVGPWQEGAVRSAYAVVSRIAQAHKP